MNAFLVCAPSGLGSVTANQYREGIPKNHNLRHQKGYSNETAVPE